MFHTKSCRETRNTHFTQNNFFFVENLAFYEIMWNKVVELGRTHIKIWRMRIACWIPKATNTHSGCVILIAFPLYERLSTFLQFSHYNKHCKVVGTQSVKP